MSTEISTTLESELRAHISREDQVRKLVIGNGEVGLLERMRSVEANLDRVIEALDKRSAREWRVVAWLAATVGGLSLTGTAWLIVWIVRHSG